MGRLISAAAARLLPVLAGLLVLAALRLPPVSAHALLPVRVLPLLAALVVAWVVAALWPRRLRARPWPVRPVLLLAGATVLGAGLARGGGLSAEIRDPRGVVARLPPSAIDLGGPDLRAVPFVRKWTIAWDGPLHVPATGAYRLWAKGRGEARVEIDGHPVLEGAGDRFETGGLVALSEGPHHVHAQLTHVGPGPQLRLGWDRPGVLGRVPEIVPAELLGERPPRASTVARDVAAHLLALACAWLVACVQPAAARRRPISSWRVPALPSLLGHLAVVAVMGWPLLADPVHLGFTASPDGRLNTWILAWDAHALVHAPSRLFQAPIFHPLPDALAFSENLLLPAVVVAPLNLAGQPVLAYNVALLLALVVSGLGAQRLAERFGASGLSAWVAGACFAAGAHRWIRLSHLHAQVTMFLPFALLALDRFHARRTWRRAFGVGLLLALQGLSSVYLGAITATCLATAAGLAALLAWRVRDTARFAIGVAAGGLLLLPVMLPYLRMRAFQGMEWTLADIAAYATTLTSYAASGTRLWGGLTQRHLDPLAVQDTLWPGVTLLALGLAGLCCAPLRFRWAAVACSLVAVVVSLGPETAVYRFLHEHVVLVRGVRALSRFSLIPILALCVGLGIATARRTALAALALVAVMLESTNAPLALARWTAPNVSLPGDGAVAVLPLGDGDTAAMLDQLAHGRPLLNGDSGFVPRPYTRAMELLEPPPAPDAWRLLRGLGVTTVVIDGHAQPVPDGDKAATRAPGAPVSTLFTDEGTILALDAPRAVTAVGFELDEDAWMDAPAVWTSDDGRAWTRRDATASLADATMSLYADPRHGRGEVVVAPVTTRFLRIDARVPARHVPFTVR